MGREAQWGHGREGRPAHPCLDGAWLRPQVALVANPNVHGGLAGPIDPEAGWVGTNGAAPGLGPAVTMCRRWARGCKTFCFSKRSCVPVTKDVGSGA